jgi:L-lactate dehydrogenase complex protein LldE
MPEKVALFVPCYVDQLAPEVGLATARVLERLGCRVEFDPRQTCCGQPFVTTGARREAVRLARAHVSIFAGAEAVVCPSASCVATVRRRYADLLGEADAEPLASRTFELGEYIVTRLGLDDVGARFPHRVALLESCHGLRELGLGRPSEVLGPAPSLSGVTERLLRGSSSAPSSGATNAAASAAPSRSAFPSSPRVSAATSCGVWRRAAPST